MNEFTIMRQIELIAASNVRSEKEALVAGLAGSEFGRYVIEQAYSSFITFGIRVNRRNPDVPRPAKQQELTLDMARSLLGALAHRELTGNAAEGAVQEMMEGLSADGAELLYLMLSKDLKCGIGDATIALAAPGLFPTFAVMRAHHHEEKRVKVFPVRGEFKLDGNRNTFLCHKGNGGFFSRNGKRVAALDCLVPTVMKVARACVMANILCDVLWDEDGDLSFMLDGEAMMGLFEETGKLRKKDYDALNAELHLYDMLSYADFDAPGAVGPDYDTRRTHLSAFVNVARQMLKDENGPDKNAIQMVPSYLLNSHEEVAEFYETARETTLAHYLARGDAERERELLLTTIDKATGLPKVMEGAMIKMRASQYEKRKSYSWLKIKAEETEDLIIVGFYNGKAGSKYENMLGGAIVDRAGVRVRVGGGWSDDLRASLWEAWKLDAAKVNVEPSVGYTGVSFSPDQVKNPDFKFDLLGHMIETEFHEVTPDGSLRHPRFVRFREDKNGEIEDKEAHIAAMAA